MKDAEELRFRAVRFADALALDVIRAAHARGEGPEPPRAPGDEGFVGHRFDEPELVVFTSPWARIVVGLDVLEVWWKGRLTLSRPWDLDGRSRATSRISARVDAGVGRVRIEHGSGVATLEVGRRVTGRERPAIAGPVRWSNRLPDGTILSTSAIGGIPVKLDGRLDWRVEGTELVGEGTWDGSEPLKWILGG